MTDSLFAPLPGVPLMLEPGLRLVLAPNASPMTERGTNTFLLGQGDITVIDPGPGDPEHLRAILAALAPGERITQILVTHTHKDHSPLARPLAEATGAPVLAFGDAKAGQSVRMTALAKAGLHGGEGVDTAFSPDERLRHGLSFDAGGRQITAVHTPGHLGNHLCFHWGDAVFTGDHIMGWAPSVVSPPEGDLTDFMTSLDTLEALGPLRYIPAHGAPVADGLTRTRALRTHRQSREAAIRAALAAGARNPVAITRAVYTDVPPALLPMAARNVLAHLIDLDARGMVRFDGVPGPETPVFPR